MSRTILFFVLTAGIIAGCKEADPARLQARVLVSEGQVDWQDAGVWKPLQVRQELKENDFLRTGADGKVDLLVRGMAGIRLLGNTEFRLESLAKEKVRAKITSGDILVKVAQRHGGTLEVETPAAIAGVRGTEFWGRVNQADETGTFAVREGTVEIFIKKSNQSVSVTQGQAVDLAPAAVTNATRSAAAGEMGAMAQIDEIRLDD